VTRRLIVPSLVSHQHDQHLSLHLSICLIWSSNNTPRFPDGLYPQLRLRVREMETTTTGIRLMPDSTAANATHNCATCNGSFTSLSLDSPNVGVDVL
jgi:hypothetical protein